MDPLLDEKIILSISRILPEIFRDTLHIQAIREAYGPSRNKGLCYEKCTAIDLSGEFNGRYFMGLDGYTKTKLLPYIARSFSMTSFSQISSSLVFMEFINLICGHLTGELTGAGFNLDISPPDNLDNELVPIDLEKVRQYIIIYFLQDAQARKYLGRIYTIITLTKYNELETLKVLEQPPVMPDWSLDIPAPTILDS